MDLSLRLENLTIAAYNGRVAKGGGHYPLTPDPCYPSYWHFLGALIRVPVQVSAPDGFQRIKDLALKIWERHGDRGWADLVEYSLADSKNEACFPMRSWLLHQRSNWPGTILQWPEQTIRDAIAMHKVLGLPHTIHDCLYAVWPLLRKDEKEVAAMLGGKPGDSMYSVLSTWGQFPYTLPPSTAGNLWQEFMAAYRRKRRPLTYNPVSLIGKDPYIVATRLEQGRF
nr:MAG TPA: hypothetical protein [Caudoviricetes sp.]